MNCSCDLLSTFIFDNVLTMRLTEKTRVSKLWFAFNFYLWQRSYNSAVLLLLQVAVVICFQLLSLTTFLQLICGATGGVVSCDLLSTFIFDNVLTIGSELGTMEEGCDLLSTFIFDNVLTIDWFVFIPSTSCDLLSTFIFDNVLTIRKWFAFKDTGCDLLSTFIFDNVLTIYLIFADQTHWLWFAFNFYLWQRSYNEKQNLLLTWWLWFAFNFYLWQRSYNIITHRMCRYTVVICFQLLSLTTFLQYFDGRNTNSLVVICFQLLSLTTFLQLYGWIWVSLTGCDLLSTFIFDNVLTIDQYTQTLWNLLWFAFNFYLWQRSYNWTEGRIMTTEVVICFQLLSLTTFLQYFNNYIYFPPGCDLLSTFIFDNVLTIPVYFYSPV